MPQTPYRVARSLLFLLPPEAAHKAALCALRMHMKINGLSPPPNTNPTMAMGLEFPNRLGLAAGFDKNGGDVDALATMGFGFIEIGAITPKPQPGNAPPRLFRLSQAQALINRMGFNNCGASQAVKNLAHRRYRGVLGINLGKNAATPLSEAAEDYKECLSQLYNSGDFFTINISSPNTAGLRDLQQGENLQALLQQVLKKRDELTKTHSRYAPVAVKISPDLSDEEIHTVADTVAKCGIDGVIACNTTSARPPPVAGLRHAAEEGGLSGKPLAARATAVIKTLRSHLPDDIAIIGVGGIQSVLDAQEKLQAGAQLLQIYTGLIYQGPGLAMKIIKAL